MHAPVDNTELRNSKKQMVSGTYLRNAWYVAAWSDDLAEGKLLARTIMKEPVVLYRKADGSPAALHDRCPHRFAPLSMGKIVHGDAVQCPYHGLEFDASGACTLNPHGTKNIPSRARVRRPSAVSAGSTAALPTALAPDTVRSVHGEKTTAEEGCGRPASLSARRAAVTRPPPADSPTNAILSLVGPSSSRAR